MIALALLLAGIGQPPPDSAVVQAEATNPNLPTVLAPPAEFAPPAPARTAFGVLTDFQLVHTHITKGGNPGFGIDDTEFVAGFNTPWEPLGKPVKVKFGFASHLWDGPGRKLDRPVVYDTITFPDGSTSRISDFGNKRPPSVPKGPDPGVPPALYDLYLDIGWRPRLAEWLFADLGVTPGVYGDFSGVGSDFFRLRGRGLAVVALSERFQFVGGGLYVNRNRRKLVPAGGVLWKPNDAMDLQLVFPVPKASVRAFALGDGFVWGYVAGEFGGGTWAYREPDGSAGSVDSNDYRFNVGAEWRRPGGWAFRTEVGYVFGRELVYADGRKPFETANAMLLRAGIVY